MKNFPFKQVKCCCILKNSSVSSKIIKNLFLIDRLFSQFSMSHFITQMVILAR